MRKLIFLLMSKGYDVFIPIVPNNELVVSCSMFTKRCYYRPVTHDKLRGGCYISNESLCIQNRAHTIDDVITYNDKCDVFLIPIRDILNKRMIRLNSKEHYKMQHLLNDIPTDALATEISNAQEAVDEQNYYRSVIDDLAKKKELDLDAEN